MLERSSAVVMLCTVTAILLSACGGGSGGSSGETVPTMSYLGTTGVFAAWANTQTGVYSVAATNTYAGKKQSLRGNIDYTNGLAVSGQAGIEVFKGSSGNIYALDLVGTSTPVAQQLSSETAATIDDTCTLSGTANGGNSDYVGVYFAADLVTTTNSSYIYRLPGPDGACNTEDDTFHMVKTGMSSSAAPIVVSAMPVATVRTAQGGVSGFVIKSGSTLALVDSNFANPVTLGTFSAPVNVAIALPVGITQGYPTGQLFIVDGNIVYVDYAAKTVSATLYAIPNWTPVNNGAAFAASPDTLYFSINTAASGATPATASLMSMPADGSAAPSMQDTVAGRILAVLYPVEGTNLLFSVLDTSNTYGIHELLSVGSETTLVSSTQNGGTFIATAGNVYYETWTSMTDAKALSVTRTNTQSGITAMNGTIVQAPLADSTFLNGGEQQAWPSDTTTTATPYITVFQVQGLTPVTVVNTTSGYTYTEDGVSGGSLVSIDCASNQTIATIGILPTSTATTLNGTFRGSQRAGFIEAATPVSTENPQTRDLYILQSTVANGATRTTNNL